MDENGEVIVGMLSLGCPKNLVDSEVLLGLLAQVFLFLSMLHIVT